MWRIPRHSKINKSFTITGPIYLQVDYDDVDHDKVDIIAKEIARILNEHLDEKAVNRWLKRLPPKLNE